MDVRKQTVVEIVDETIEIIKNSEKNRSIYLTSLGVTGMATVLIGGLPGVISGTLFFGLSALGGYMLGKCKEEEKEHECKCEEENKCDNCSK